MTRINSIPVSIQYCWLMMLLSVKSHGAETEPVATRFMLQQVEGQYCLTLDVREDEFSSCVYVDPDKGGLCYPRNRAILSRCDEGSSSQRWSYDDQKKHIFYQGYSSSMCLSRMVETVEMLPCSNEVQGQIWFFNQDKELVSAADKEFPRAYLRLLGKNEFDPRPLSFRFDKSDMDSRECFRSPLSGLVECAVPEEPELDGNRDTAPNDSGERGSDGQVPGEDGSGQQDPEKTNPEPEQPVDEPGKSEAGTGGSEGSEDKQPGDQEEKQSEPSKEDVQPDLKPGECSQNPETGVVTCSEAEKPASAIDWDSPEGLFWVSDKLTQDIEFTYTVNNICLQIEEPAACLKQRNGSRECYSGQRVDTATCLGQDQALWKYDLKTKRIFNKAAGYGYCLSWLEGHFLLMPCFAGSSPAQKWYFGLESYAAPLEWGRLKTSVQGGLKPYGYLRVLDFPASYDPAASVRGGRSVNYEPFGELCGYEPVEGKWTGNCTN